MKSSIIYFFSIVLFTSLISCSFLKTGDRTPSSSTGEGFLPADLTNSVFGEIENATVHLTGDSGFFKKVAMLENALPGSTISMAYFIFEDDYSSAFLVQKMLAAADRGVNIRLMVDYFMSEKYIPWLQFISSNPKIKIKRFRPPTKDFKNYLDNELAMKASDAFIKGLMSQNSELLLMGMMSSDTVKPLIESQAKLLEDLKKLKEKGGISPEELNGLKFSVLQSVMTNPGALETVKSLTKMRSFLRTFLRRMHHKIAIAHTSNGKEFIVGGRNISDEYHIGADELKHEKNLLKGRSYPFYDCEVSGLFAVHNSTEDFEDTFDKLWGSTLAVLLPNTKLESAVLGELQKNMLTKANIYLENIARMKERGEHGTYAISDKVLAQYVENSYLSKLDGKEITLAWQHLIENATSKIQIVSAYLYLYPELIESLKVAASNGVQIDIYTNSATTTDLSIVNVGAYSQMNDWIAKIGAVNFYELGLGKQEGSLHAKIINVDDIFVGIGSANSDPRSHLFDTNNLMIMNFKKPTSAAQEVFSFYLEKLPWEKITPKKLQGILSNLQTDEKSKTVLKVTQLQDVIDQL
ncbi:MAG: hypothetical protein A2381_13905 [Bdellovibrionales bacterium RIFOXYB1_FULL_37_110]|nr:MAG: hypothetical protein A2417_05540 [Bdellovibrionales bacterium RIFOXYC1_FULL_37_79]OFZ56955.1 MAG: hypothetical protein A2381_13905 [Bdellovibrionales bacterium RIFOXYB1_FULL_37_110]OFZ62042.1 MAG: hypothetical protein A2577_19375 [Bdellovibrionales bacterium RIFOXYD1_FULL_36_51]